MEKGDRKPDRLVLDEKGQLVLYYGKVEARMGSDKNMDEKMSRLMGIIPQLEGMEGVLHLENVDETSKNVVFDKVLSEAEQKALEDKENKSGDGTDESDTGDEDSDGSDDESGYEDSDEGSYEEYDTGYEDSGDGDMDYNEEDSGYGDGSGYEDYGSDDGSGEE